MQGGAATYNAIRFRLVNAQSPHCSTTIRSTKSTCTAPTVANMPFSRPLMAITLPTDIGHLGSARNVVCPFGRYRPSGVTFYNPSVPWRVFHIRR